MIEKLRLVRNDTSCDNRNGTFVATNNVKGDSEKLSVGAADDHGGQGRVFLINLSILGFVVYFWILDIARIYISLPTS